MPLQSKKYMKSLGIIFYLLSFFGCLSAQPGLTEWPLFRGKADLTGNFDTELPSSPSLVWSLATGARTKSSPVLTAGTIFFGNEKGTRLCSQPGRKDKMAV